MADLLDRLSGLDPKRLALLTLELQSRLDALDRARREPIAVVGIGCRFPGDVDGPDAFWRLLRDGVDAITTVPRERWDADAYYDPDPDAAGRISTRWGGFLRDVDRFDARFFGITPREAASMDPQQRILLEVAWAALEHAGQAPDRLARSRTGVFVGCGGSDYRQLQGRANDPAAIDAYALTGTALNAVAGRLSYALGLQGPSLVVDTACSSSLVAIHLAVQSLRSGECRMALAGGVNVILVPDGAIATSRAHMMAADGRCKTFDAAADGFVRSEGCGIVVLKRLSDAEADGDTVLALIRGSAVNQDGPSSGFTVPNGLSQEALIREALEAAGVAPADVGYVEAHGTGTALGDPIEVGALGAALGTGRPPERALLVGSVKTNIGHAESAAGVAGFIKAVLTLQHAEIPPHLHLQSINPEISVLGLPVEVPVVRTPWPACYGRTIAGVSSFGASGTNAHVVLEAAPIPKAATPAASPGPARSAELLLLSARTETALQALARQTAAFLRRVPEAALADVCAMLVVGRAQLGERLVVVAASTTEAAASLEAFAAGQSPAGLMCGRATGSLEPFTTNQAAPSDGDLEAWRRYLGEIAAAWVQGRDVGRSTLIGNRPFRKLALPTYPFERERHWIDARDVEATLLPAEYGETGHSLLGRRLRSPALHGSVFESCISPTRPAFLADHRLWGTTVLPAAAYVELGLAASAASGRPPSLTDVVMQEAMTLADEMPRIVQTILTPSADGPTTFRIVSCDADGDPDTGVWTEHASGRLAPGEAEPQPADEAASLAAVRERCREALPADAFYQRLHAAGFEFGPGFQRIEGFWRGAGEALGLVTLPPELAAAGDQFQLHPAVLDSCFQVVGALLAQSDPDAVFMPIGVGAIHLLGQGTPPLWSHVTVRPEQGSSDETRAFDLRLFDDAGRLVARIDGLRFRRASQAAMLRASQSRLDDCFYQVVWRPASDGNGTTGPETSSTLGTRADWLIFADDSGLGSEIARHLEARGDHATLVYCTGDPPAGPSSVQVDPTSPDDFVRLLRETQPADSAGREVVYLWGLNERLASDSTASALEAAHVRSCGGLLHLVQALAQAGQGRARLRVVTRGAQAIHDPSGPVAVAQASLWGLGRVVAREHPDLQVSLIDLDTDPVADDTSALLASLLTGGAENQVALRDGVEYRARLARAALPAQSEPLACRPDATYLVTGGLGGLGLQTAGWLVERGARHVVLVSRGAPTPEATEVIARLEGDGTQVYVRHADVADEHQVAGLFAEIERTLPPLRGVIHAAGVLDDGLIINQRWERFQPVLAPKVSGGWNLHHATRHLSLDFFVLFSSMAAVFGPPGQSNYAAANAFLGALAHHRRSLGLAAVAIDWGVWGGVGLAARSNMNDSLLRWGMREIDPPDGLALLERALLAGPAQIGALKVDWSLFLRQFPPGRAPQFLAELAAEARPSAKGDPAQAAWADFRRRLEQARPADQWELLQAQVSTAVAGIMRLDSAHHLGPTQPFFEVGMDSLMAVELRSNLERGLGAVLPATLTFEYPNIAALTDYLGGEVLGIARPTRDDLRARIEAERRAAALAELDQLSETELAAMLDEHVAGLLGGKERG